MTKATPTSGGFRSFAPAAAKGGANLVASKTAVLFIEYQNEFATVGGKLHDAVKDVMAATDMLDKSVQVAIEMRAAGGKVFHAPISFAADGSDNPNKGLGILAGCAKDSLFVAGTWNAEICSAMIPDAADVIVVGKKGLDAFTNTNLEAQLIAHGIETIVLGGFMTNCCVESTMRTAFEKGFNVIGLTDCTATTSMEAQKAAVEGTYGMFSSPMTSETFLSLVTSSANQPSEEAVVATSLVPVSADASVRSFSPEHAKGGTKMTADTTAVLFIEYQNEFTSEGGKLHDAVKEVMGSSDMLQKSKMVAQETRKAGGKVFHAPLCLAADGSDNPNKGLGILAGCFKDGLFVAGTWNSEICEAMTPESSDVIVTGKKGLDAFPETDLEAQLRAHGIETIALGGFLTNCCVESTMRTAYEKGFNVITLTDCTATTSMEGQKAAAEGTYSMFSVPHSAAEFVEKLGDYSEVLI